MHQSMSLKHEPAFLIQGWKARSRLVLRFRDFRCQRQIVCISCDIDIYAVCDFSGRRNGRSGRNPSPYSLSLSLSLPLSLSLSLVLSLSLKSAGVEDDPGRARVRDPDPPRTMTPVTPQVLKLIKSTGYDTWLTFWRSVTAQR